MTIKMNQTLARIVAGVSLVTLSWLPLVASAASASLSPTTLDLSTGQTGSSTLSGNDSNSSKTFRWSYSSGLSVSKGSYSNLSSFSVDAGKRTISITTRGRGSFSATMNFSSSNAGSYSVSNTRADISLNPKNIAVNVSSSSTSSSGGGGMGGGGGGGGMGGGGAGGAVPVLSATNVTLVARQINRTMSDGANIPFWVFCENGMGGGGGGCTLPSPAVLTMHYNETANIVLNMMMAPQENPPYHGHTIHPHGVDVPQSEDGVPETGAAVLGDTYTFRVDSRYVGGHMYHCHVHTVKHLEMGMYGALIVRGDGNEINRGGPTFDYEWNWVLSTVDPAYHTATGDSTVFADYNPRYFLINGNEGRSRTTPSETMTAAPGAKVAIRLIGIHSVNSEFRVLDANGSARSFVVHNVDGFKLPSPKTVTSVEVSPGQTKDVMVTLPTSSGTWYPQVTYRNLRNAGAYSNGTVYSQLNF
jgi:hypothetical protein